MFNWTTHTPISSSPVDLELVNPVPRQLRQDCSGSPLGKSPDPTRGGATQLIESLAWKVSGPSFSRNHRNTTCFFFMGVWEYGSTAHFCWLPWFYFSFLKLLQCFSLTSLSGIFHLLNTFCLRECFKNVEKNRVSTSNPAEAFPIPRFTPRKSSIRLRLRGPKWELRVRCCKPLFFQLI